MAGIIGRTGALLAMVVAGPFAFGKLDIKVSHTPDKSLYLLEFFDIKSRQTLGIPLRKVNKLWAIDNSQSYRQQAEILSKAFTGNSLEVAVQSAVGKASSVDRKLEIMGSINGGLTIKVTEENDISSEFTIIRSTLVNGPKWSIPQDSPGLTTLSEGKEQLKVAVLRSLAKLMGTQPTAHSGQTDLIELLGENRLQEPKQPFIFVNRTLYWVSNGDSGANPSTIPRGDKNTPKHANGYDINNILYWLGWIVVSSGIYLLGYFSRPFIMGILDRKHSASARSIKADQTLSGHEPEAENVEDIELAPQLLMPSQSQLAYTRNVSTDIAHAHGGAPNATRREELTRIPKKLNLKISELEQSLAKAQQYAKDLKVDLEDQKRSLDEQNELYDRAKKLTDKARLGQHKAEETLQTILAQKTSLEQQVSGLQGEARIRMKEVDQLKSEVMQLKRQAQNAEKALLDVLNAILEPRDSFCSADYSSRQRLPGIFQDTDGLP